MHTLLHTLLTFGLLGRAVGFSVLPAVPLVRRLSATTYREVLRPARELLPPGSFSYVDCRPFDDLTTEGRWFLATNLCFALTGGVFATAGGSPSLGVCFELAGTHADSRLKPSKPHRRVPALTLARTILDRFSTFYHWAQLRLGGTSHPVVQIALLFDYLCAFPTIGGGLAYAGAAVSAGAHLPLGAILCGGGATVAFVAACLPVCHEPRRYMLVHGLWHVQGAAAGLILASSDLVAR